MSHFRFLLALVPHGPSRALLRCVTVAASLTGATVMAQGINEAPSTSAWPPPTAGYLSSLPPTAESELNVSTAHLAPLASPIDDEPLYTPGELMTRDDVEQIVSEYLARERIAAQTEAQFASELQAQPAALATEPAPGGVDALRKEWQEFLTKAKTGYPNVAINGVFQADLGYFNQDVRSRAAYGVIENGASFRRARLSAKGSVTETVNYFFQMDFAFFGRPTFTDVWVEQTALPVLGNWRIGQWKQPFSLEVVSSFRYTTFMERSLLFQAFTPFRHLGTGFFDHSEDLENTWAASVFRSGQDQFGGSIGPDGGWSTAERVTWCPYYDEPSNGRYYLHLGAGHYFNSPQRNLAIFRSIPEIFVGENVPILPLGTSGQPVPGAQNGTPFFVSTGPLRVQNYNVLGSEILWVRGPFSFQCETMFNFVDQENHPNATLWGNYAQVGYFLTGEHRPYDRALGAIDRIQPFENFFRIGGPRGCCMGSGAWELAARWSFLDLNDKNIAGGTMNDVTLGINWYWNPYSKLVFNYIRAMPNLPATGRNNTNIFGCMAQVDF